MSMMSTKEAAQNLDNLIATSRMTRQEHVGMQQSLELLKTKALDLDEREQSDKEAIKGEDE